MDPLKQSLSLQWGAPPDEPAVERELTRFRPSIPDPPLVLHGWDWGTQDRSYFLAKYLRRLFQK